MLNYNSSSFITSGGEGNMIITRGYQAKNTKNKTKPRGCQTIIETCTLFLLRL